MRFSFNRCPGCMAMVDDPNEDCGLCTKKHPRLTCSPAPRGPYASIYGRIAGQFWFKMALLAADLKEGPSRMNSLQ